eukprot:7079157-Pyramimonas_sp.AAC.1
MDRAADRVQSSRFNRETRLIILSPIGVRTITVAALQLELGRKSDNVYQVDSNNTNRFVDLARLADRFQTYGLTGDRA